MTIGQMHTKLLQISFCIQYLNLHMFRSTNSANLYLTGKYKEIGDRCCPNVKQVYKFFQSF